MTTYEADENGDGVYEYGSSTTTIGAPGGDVVHAFTTSTSLGAVMSHTWTTYFTRGLVASQLGWSDYNGDGIHDGTYASTSSYLNGKRLEENVTTETYPVFPSESYTWTVTCTY